MFTVFGKVTDSDINPDGIGLGLIICQKLATQMGGEIGFESEYG